MSSLLAASAAQRACLLRDEHTPRPEPPQTEPEKPTSPLTQWRCGRFFKGMPDGDTFPPHTPSGGGAAHDGTRIKSAHEESPEQFLVGTVGA